MVFIHGPQVVRIGEIFIASSILSTGVRLGTTYLIEKGIENRNRKQVQKMIAPRLRVFKVTMPSGKVIQQPSSRFLQNKFTKRSVRWL